MAESFFDRIHKQDTHTPDVLSCLANLSNDEVFTPPEVVNQMLDMLPQELFKSRDTKFLDPACKTGVFLREIAKRLLENQAPGYKERMVSINEYIKNGTKLSQNDEEYMQYLQQVLDHIFHEQLYGIAITELTSMLSRRSLYCSKYPNGRYSITKFDNAEGNIRFKRIQHTWKGNNCIYCGASKKEYDRKQGLETYAYEFIHLTNLEDLKNMKFDVIISNPPYQLSDGGAQASAMPIYHHFVEQAKKLNPSYVVMITPSRWFSGGKGLDNFRNEMLHDQRLEEIHDFTDAKDCFPGVEIKGGVSYFKWNNKHNGDCKIISHKNGNIVSEDTRPLLEENTNVFIRHNELVSIYRKVSLLNEGSFSQIISPRKPFGLCGDFFADQSKYGLPKIMDRPYTNGYNIYGLENNKRTIKYIDNKYPIPRTEYLNGWKMFMARNQGSGQFGEKLSTPIFAGKRDLCTETYVVIGLFKTKEEMMNCWSYIRTKFFRALLSVKKNDQGAASGVYEYIPIQDFSKPWTDEELYKKYKLTKEEIKYIEDNVQPMEDE